MRIKERGWLDLLGSIPSLGFTTYGGLLRLARLSRLARITRLLRAQNKKELVDDIVNNRNQYTAFITILMTIIGALASILSSILVGAPAAAEEAPIGPDGQPIPAKMLAPASRADIVQLQNELAALRQMMEKISGADGQVRAAEIKE